MIVTVQGTILQLCDTAPVTWLISWLSSLVLSVNDIRTVVSILDIKTIANSRFISESQQSEIAVGSIFVSKSQQSEIASVRLFEVQTGVACIHSQLTFVGTRLSKLQAGAAGIQSQLVFSIGTRLIKLRTGTAENKVSVEKIVIAESCALVIDWAYKHSPLRACDSMFFTAWVTRSNSNSFSAHHNKRIARIGQAHQNDHP